MSQYREYITRYRISSADIVIISDFVDGSQKADTILRDGSMDTNFKAACAAHRDVVLSLGATSTSTPCSVLLKNKWVKMVASATVASNVATMKVPTGNSGILVVHLDTTGYTVKYSLSGGGFTTTITDGGTITVTDGQTLQFEALAVASFDFQNGSVTDQDTGVQVDVISLMNSTP
jgi:hypothetical protein